MTSLKELSRSASTRPAKYKELEEDRDCPRPSYCYSEGWGVQVSSRFQQFEGWSWYDNAVEREWVMLAGLIGFTLVLPIEAVAPRSVWR